MVLLLNLLIPAFLLVIGLIWWKSKNWKVLLAIPFFFLLYWKVQPSYLPKGDIQRTEVPTFELNKAEIRDNNRKPVPSEVRNAEQERKYQEGLVFIE